MKRVLFSFFILVIISAACIQVQKTETAPAPSTPAPASTAPAATAPPTPEEVAASFNLPYVALFTIQPFHTMANLPVIIKWDVKASTNIIIEPNIGIVEPSGSKEITTTMGTTTYKLTATNAAGTVIATTTLTIAGIPPGRDTPVVKQFTASPHIIKKGETTTLTWKTIAASAVTVAGNTVAAEGSTQVSPTETTTYTIIATSTDGTQYQTVTVNVK